MRVDLGARLAAEADDDVGQVGLARRAVEARGQPVGDGHRRARHRRGEQDAGEGQPAAPHGSRRPSTQAQDAIGGAGGRLVVGHEDDRAAVVGRAAQEPEDRGARLGVEVAGRLVGQHERRVVDQRASDRQALLLAAAELVGQPRRRRR